MQWSAHATLLCSTVGSFCIRQSSHPTLLHLEKCTMDTGTCALCTLQCTQLYTYGRISYFPFFSQFQVCLLYFISPSTFFKVCVTVITLLIPSFYLVGRVIAFNTIFYHTLCSHYKYFFVRVVYKISYVHSSILLYLPFHFFMVVHFFPRAHL